MKEWKIDPKLPEEACGMLTVHFKEPPRVLLKENLREAQKGVVLTNTR